jgi:hypothetical protein
MDPVPVTGLAANFSPIPRIAPPPLGSEIEGSGLAPLTLSPVGTFWPGEPRPTVDEVFRVIVIF